MLVILVLFVIFMPQLKALNSPFVYEPYTTIRPNQLAGLFTFDQRNLKNFISPSAVEEDE